jgi:hypothetical protein
LRQEAQKPGLAQGLLPQTGHCGMAMPRRWSRMAHRPGREAIAPGLFFEEIDELMRH